MPTADSKHQVAETGASGATIQNEDQERCPSPLSSGTNSLRSSGGMSATAPTAAPVSLLPTATTESPSLTPPNTTTRLTAPVPLTGPSSLLFNASPQRTFFSIAELVAEVVGYLSSSRQDVVKCLYLSKTFYAAALPLVYKYIPLQCLNIVDPVLKEKHLRSVIMSQIDGCTDDMLHLVPAGCLAFFEEHEDIDYYERTGWVSISKRQSNVVLHFSCDDYPYAHDLLGLSLDTTLPIAPEETLTIVFVPPYISGHDFDIMSFDPYSYASMAADFPIHGTIKLVGLDFHDPFKSRGWNALDLKPSFLHALDRFFFWCDEDWEGWENSPLSKDEFKDSIISRIEYITFKDYLETSGDWKNVLNWRKVGEWLNKYDERLSEENSLVKKNIKDKTEPETNWSKDPSSACAHRGAREHLPSGRIEYDPFRYVKEW